MKIKLKLLGSIIITLFVGSFLANYLHSYSTLFMPEEYKTIKKLVNKLASSNHLGGSAIPFNISNGIYMAYRAEELGLCKDESCWYYRNLNPYKKYNKVKGININELSNQSFLFNGIEAYAWQGVVWLSKSTFRTYGDRKDFLNCTLGHEISHIVFNDHLEQEKKLSDRLRDLRKLNNLDLEKEKNIFKEKKELLEMEISRDSEMTADINSAKMIINAGYPKDTCLKEITFLSKISRIENDTDEKSTHPGYAERYQSLENFINTYDKDKEMNSFKPYKWKWKYNRNKNTLTFKPDSK